MTKPAPTRPAAGSKHHHGSHRGLLAAPKNAAGARVDAIIVPTARKPRAITHAIGLAEALGCTLLVLCSKLSNATDVAELARRRGVEVIAIDMGQLPSGLLPHFETSALLACTKFDRRTDTSAKRNLGILIARMMGWRRIVFLDDDIVVPNPVDLTRAAGLTDRYAGVGLHIGGFPDNSVVCHAYREAGGPQDMFVGGGALAVGVGSMGSFFPSIYNEDWFFLLDRNGLRPTAITGRVIQKEYDPFALDDRARMEELGDCLAEGLFWLVDEGKSIKDADAAYWRESLRRRADFIADVAEMVGRMKGEPGRRSRMLSSLRAARGRCLYIKPELCENYVRAWQTDRVRWAVHMAQYSPNRKRTRRLGDPEKVIARLGLTFQAKYLPRQDLHEDPADLDSSVAVAVGG